MILWILIPSYLWKNTYKRWLENPISPITKLVTSFLLALLSLFILGYFAQTEKELQKRLEETDIYSIQLKETISNINSISKLTSIYEEEQMWKKAFGENEVKSFFQLLGYASSPGKSNLPVIVFPDYFEELSTPAGKAPIIWYLSKEHQLLENPTTVEIFRKRIQAVPKKMPQAVLDKLQFKTVIAVPLEAALPLLVSGGVNHTFAELHTSKQVKHFIEVAQGYYAAEGRPTSLQSSIEVLDQLSQLDLIHNKIRHIIILFSGGMLALIIGSISWLELRQEIYLISLLRSFGVGKTIIIFHQFFENLMIIGTGVLISLYSWNKVYSSLTKSLPTLTSSDSVTILPADIQTLALFSLIGAILSSLPVVIGIRKQIGLILQ